MSYDAITKEAASLSFNEQLNLLAFLANLIKSGGRKNMDNKASKCDYTDTYPKGFFDLFGSDPTYPDVL